MPVEDRLYIGGDWVAPAGTGVIEVISPTTEEKVGQVPEGTTADIDKAVAAARAAFDSSEWTRMAPEERAQILSSISSIIQGRADEIARLITNENGSPYSWGIMGQVFASTMVADFYAGLAKEFTFSEERAGTMGNKALVRKLPVGVVGGIVPWNVPLFTTMLKLAPAMVAGATMVLKPAPETPLDAQVLAEIAHEAGLPAGVLNIVPAGREVGEHLVTHPDVDKIAFTGSPAAGRKIAALCGERLRRVTLELGGKSASIIMDDADLAQVVPALVPAGTMNNGQACVAQTRILASRDRYDEVVEAIAEAVGNLKVGDPLDPETEIGPLTAERQRDRVEGYLASGQEQGAKVVVGGGRPADQPKGWFVEPTVFSNVSNDMRIAQEEIFGPVLSVIPYDDIDDAVKIANDSDYGLSGSVYGADVDTATEIAGRVRTGTTAVNGFMLEFGCPFGGFKGSGLGRELGPEGLEAYLELQSVSLPAG